MTAPQKKPKLLDFDPNKLGQLGVPFQLTVELRYGSARTPVQLPDDPTVKARGGYGPEDIANLASLLPQLGGGGNYRCLAIDDAGQSHEWEWYYNPSQIPPKPVPAVAAAQVAQSSPFAPPQQVQSTQQPHAFTGVLAGTQPQQAVFQNPIPLRPLPPTPPADPFADPLWQERQRVLELQYDAKIKEQAQVHNDRLAALERRMEQNAQTQAHAVAAAAVPAVSPAIEARLAEAERRAADAERRATEAEQRRLADAAQAVQDQRFREMEARQDALLASVNQAIAGLAVRPATGPDPTVQLLAQMIQTNGEQSRASVQAIVDQIRETSKGAMGISDIMNMMRQMNDQQGLPQVLGKVTESFGGIMSMFRDVVELQMQMKPEGSSPVVEMAGQALGAIQGAVGEWLKGREQSKAAELQTRAVETNARAQMAAMQMQREMNAQAQQQRPVVMQPQPPVAPVLPTSAAPPAPAPDLAGAPANDGTDGEGEEGGGDETGANGAPVVAAAGGESYDPEELRLFGDERILKSVLELRQGVAMGNLAPEQCAQAILVGAKQIKSLGLSEKSAVFRLYEQKVFPMFVEALLPDAEHGYRMRVTALISQGLVPN